MPEARQFCSRADRADNKTLPAGLRIDGDSVAFRLSQNTQKVDMNQIVGQFGRALELSEPSPGEYKLSYSAAALKEMQSDLLRQSIEIVDRRVNELGTREPIIQRQGDNRILLQVPGLQDPKRLKDLLGKIAKMTFHLVDHTVPEESIQAPGAKVPPGTLVLPGDDPADARSDGQPRRYAVYERALLSGDMLTDARMTFDQQNSRPVVAFTFNAIGARKFADITSNNVGKQFAIVLDGKVITAPVIQSAILGGHGIITGHFTAETARDLAVLLRAGALPAPLKIIEERTIGPTLGADSIEAGKKASVLGLLLVMTFMLWAYGRFGLYANLSLLMNLVILVACLSMFHATLTLPGIAGVVLMLGMAVDANVLIYERIREEMRSGKTPLSAVDNGFKTAFGTIFDSNLTTLIAAALLFYFGTGAVRGFAITLSIGILASMFTAVLLTRMMVVLWLRRTRPKSLGL